MPLRDPTTNRLLNLQFIGEAGSKRFLTGGRVKGCCFLIGEPGDVLCIAEGFATGASVHEATGYAVAVAFDCGNLQSVAEAMRARFPNARIVIAADDDYQTAGNPGLTKAREAAAAIGGSVAVPDFGATDRTTRWTSTILPRTAAPMRFETASGKRSKASRTTPRRQPRRKMPGERASCHSATS